MPGRPGGDSPHRLEQHPRVRILHVVGCGQEFVKSAVLHPAPFELGGQTAAWVAQTNRDPSAFRKSESASSRGAGRVIAVPFDAAKHVNIFGTSATNNSKCYQRLRTAAEPRLSEFEVGECLAIKRRHNTLLSFVRPLREVAATVSKNNSSCWLLVLRPALTKVSTRWAGYSSFFPASNSAMVRICRRG